MNNELRAAALAYLQQRHVLTLATCTPTDLWAAAVFYVNSGFDLIFLSAGHTRHAQNMAINPQAAATIQADYADWREIKGMQLEGRVQQLTGAEREMAITLYKTRFPFLQDAPPPVQRAFDQVNWYRLTPTRLYLVDNSQGFGHRDQVL